MYTLQLCNDIRANRVLIDPETAKRLTGLMLQGIVTPTLISNSTLDAALTLSDTLNTTLTHSNTKCNFNALSKHNLVLDTTLTNSDTLNTTLTRSDAF